MSVKITYFAHGTTIDNENRISSGWNDAKLSLLGIKQSKELGHKVEYKKFDVVFCSDQSRTIDLAQFVFEGKLPVIIDSRIRECNYGQLNGARADMVEPMCDGECIYNKFPGGESYEDVKNRVSDFLEFLKKNYDGKCVALFTNKAPQLALDVLLKGKTWEEALREDWRKTKAWRPGWEYQLD